MKSIWKIFLVLGCALVHLVRGQTPSYMPTKDPTFHPTFQPSQIPTFKPSRIPTFAPTQRPSVTPRPSVIPTVLPTSSPTNSMRPTPVPTSYPSSMPSMQPSTQPSAQPTGVPSSQPSVQPTTQPSQPTSQPTTAPSRFISPTSLPSAEPSVSSAPTRPTVAPTFTVTRTPTFRPSRIPTKVPTASPTAPTIAPSTRKPSALPTVRPTRVPTQYPTHPTSCPSSQPSRQPFSRPTSYPKADPTGYPTSQPTAQPTRKPTFSQHPSSQPTMQPSGRPSLQPTTHPTSQPNVTVHPSTKVTACPSSAPSSQPSIQPTCMPSAQPSMRPTSPTHIPTTALPSSQPSSRPSVQPTSQPSAYPSSQPSMKPTNPTSIPSAHPTPKPTTAEPSYTASPTLSMSPTSQPTNQPSSVPSSQPSLRPTSSPSLSWRPSVRPTSIPTSHPSPGPTAVWGVTNKPTQVYDAADVVGTVEILPSLATPCQSVALLVGFTIERNLSAGFTMTISTPGITSGECTIARRGKSINNLMYVADAAITAQVSFVEGTVAKKYLDSKVVLRMASDFNGATHGGDTHFVHIDRFNGLKASCFSSQNRSWDVFVASETSRNVLVGSLSVSGAYPSNTHASRSVCAAYSSSISFEQAYPHYPTAINMSFYLPQVLAGPVDDPVITVYLPYFTNQAASESSSSAIHPYNSYMFGNELDSAKPQSLINVTSSTSFSWYGTVSVSYDTSYFNSAVSRYTPRSLYRDTESIVDSPDRESENDDSSQSQTSATYDTQTPPFMKQMQRNFGVMVLALRATGYMSESDSPEPFWIYIPSENRLTPVCGLQENSSHVQYQIYSQNFRVNQTRFESVQGIGHACDDYDHCQNHGDCDYCAQQCICHDGFGSENDRQFLPAGDALPKDCSGRVCPSGPSSFAMSNFREGRSNDSSFVDLHRYVECSNQGICNRRTGHCQCQKGFAGAACERSECPLECSNRGRCVRLQRLGIEIAAFPLSSGSSSVPTQYDDHKIYGMNKGAAAWDAQRGSACVCDSSWAVGLQNGQTQLSEFFGVACEQRRCPSGDDPDTVEDETDCEGKNQSNGLSENVGMAGNKCHIDCSNRGLCDYGTGICQCFGGYSGHNCNTKTTL